MSIINFRVVGTPAPQGSTSSFVVNGRAVTRSKSRNLVEWRRAIADEARRAHNFAPALTGPLAVTVSFYLRRPKSTPKRVTHPATRPDLDKLVRAVLDALSVDARVIDDDARVIQISASKHFALADQAEGADITVWSVV